MKDIVKYIIKLAEEIDNTNKYKILPGECLDVRNARLYGKDVADWIDEILNQKRNGREIYEYADNFRTAVTDDPQDMLNYEAAQDRGCCGSFDRKFNYKGKDYWIGFNYGH